MPEFDYQVYLLSQKFTADYPLSKYPELMYKDGRPYTCLLIKTHDDYFLCVPFRSSINHRFAYHFSSTQRSRRTKSGLDYSKTVVIRDTEYIDSSVPAIVDQDEYSEMVRNLPQIVEEVFNYVNAYISHKKGVFTLHPREFQRRYAFSTLPYFDRFFGI